MKKTYIAPKLVKTAIRARHILANSDPFKSVNNSYNSGDVSYSNERRRGIWDSMSGE